MAWVLEAVSRAPGVDTVAVATDDARIADAVRSRGGIAVETPSSLPSGTDRVAMAAEILARDSGSPGGCSGDDIVVNVQGDEPLIDPMLVASLADVLRSNPQWDMATAAAPIASREDLLSPNVVKIVRGRDGGALYFSRSPIPAQRDGEADFASGLFVRHLGIYAYRVSFLRRYVSEPPCALERAEKLEQLRALWMGAKIAVLDVNDCGVGVDTPEDAERVAKILQNRG